MCFRFTSVDFKCSNRLLLREFSLNLIFSPCRVHLFQMRESITAASFQRAYIGFQRNRWNHACWKHFSGEPDFQHEFLLQQRVEFNASIWTMVPFHRTEYTDGMTAWIRYVNYVSVLLLLHPVARPQSRHVETSAHYLRVWNSCGCRCS